MNVILLSPRQWLAHAPRLTQLTVVLLTLLGVVAPTWHVCALGGHAMGGHAMGGHGGHQHARFKVTSNADGSPGPVICACARHDDETPGQTFAPRPAAHDHLTCLALLLQTMPHQMAATPTLWRLPGVTTVYPQTARVVGAFALPLARRGRAPPPNC